MAREALIVGAGIVGLASAWHLARAGWTVTVLDRNSKPKEASVRNFGMVWPIGQPVGYRRDLALRSRDLWLEAAKEAGLWRRHCGSLHVFHHPLERIVAEEWLRMSDFVPGVKLVESEEVPHRSPLVRAEGCVGALWSQHEVCVDPRTAPLRLAEYLAKHYAVRFRWRQNVSRVDSGLVQTSEGSLSADLTLVCPGNGFPTMFPDLYEQHRATLVRLHMLRAEPLDGAPMAGTHLCAGLTLLHYPAFRELPSLEALREELVRRYPAQIDAGIHGLVSQHGDGTLTIGDSHEYGHEFSPYLPLEIDEAILAYVSTFARLERYRILERWHGVYCKLPEAPYLAEDLGHGTILIAGLGGAGMTLSFGVTEQVLAEAGHIDPPLGSKE